MPSPATCRHADLEARIAAQRTAVARCEMALWEGGFNARLLPTCQAAWRRLEGLIAERGTDTRHRFVLVIPVADSPVHLHDCLQSLLEQCRAYGYGGQRDGRYAKIAVLLADDSGDPAAIARQRALAAEFERAGLAIEYFGLEEQLALLDRLADLDLAPIVGHHARAAFHHKGQAMMRNIAWLRCAEIAAASADERLLFHTLDADQAFRVKIATPEGGIEAAALNYFFRLDEIFSRPGVQILTGKVVGDPPVSPAVMAGNFLEDVIAFVGGLAEAGPDAPYRQPGTAGGGDAAYHDMAELFGFQRAGQAFRYHCALPGQPGNAACFADFARHLNRFFHGEHPTRITWFEPGDALASVAPARTVYTGNCVLRPEALAWFIPFAPLRLRMSGPTMGRMLKAVLGAGFVAANLPMLHRRTLEDTGQSEFRPGVLDVNQRVDLSGEFERQFHGDVLLFAMERLVALGYPGRVPGEAEVGAVLDAVRAELYERYHAKRALILQRAEQLRDLLAAPGRWWADLPALADFHAFLDNIARNFGAGIPGDWPSWRARQVAAITGYHAHRQTWLQALARLKP